MPWPLQLPGLEVAQFPMSWVRFVALVAGPANGMLLQLMGGRGGRGGRGGGGCDIGGREWAAEAGRANHTHGVHVSILLCCWLLVMKGGWNSGASLERKGRDTSELGRSPSSDSKRAIVLWRCDDMKALNQVRSA